MNYRDGDVVNGHRYNAASNSWQPLQQTPPMPPTSQQQPGSRKNYWDRIWRRAGEKFLGNEESWVRRYVESNVHKEDYDLSTNAGRIEYVQVLREAHTRGSRQAFWKFRFPANLLLILAMAFMLLRILGFWP